MTKTKQWVVECKMVGTVSVFVEAADLEDAITKAEANEFDDSEISGWEVSEVLGADANE